MDPRPFRSLGLPRVIDTLGLPRDVMDFYSRHEGVGLDSTSDRIVRLCKLREVKEIRWNEVRILGDDETPGWENFKGLRIGVSSFFDEIIYVLSAPCHSAGSILTIGPDVAGPGGTLVLANTFPEWIRHLEDMAWVEYGLVPGSIAKLPKPMQVKLHEYYKALNPQISWHT